MKPGTGMFSGTKGVWTYSAPQKAYDIYDYVMSHNGSPPKTFVGGSIYKNEPNEGEAKLPDGVKYKEYDVNPHIKGQDRGDERLVIDENGVPYYTDSHYKSFIRLDIKEKGE